MSESDQTWNADDRGPEPANPSWPQYTWPPVVSEASTPGTPAESGAPEPWPSVSWPPVQPDPPVQTDPTVPYPTVPATGPYASAPYSGDPYSGGRDAAWTPPPPGWGGAGPTGSAAWPPVPPVPPVATAPTAPHAPTKARRGVAALAALALVLASAGVGAGVAIAVHNNSDTRSFSADTTPSGNGGLGNNGGFGNNGTSGNNGTGTVPFGSGTLDTNAIAAKVDPALVNINTTLAQGRAAGTGMLISSTGEILTNNHVIADATRIRVTIGGTGATYDAKVVGYDVTEDVALLQITDKVSNLPTITFGDPSKVQVGDPVVAIGNALGQGGTPKASQGHVTALDQQVTAGDEGGTQETLEGMIQINAPIQPGDSGGALVDASGKVIGMNTAAAGGGQFNARVGSNVGFAIAIDNAVGIVSQIRSGTETDKVHIGDRALLGVQVQDLNGQNSQATSGALVVGVQPNTGAADAGIQTNDVLTTLNGKPITDSASLRLGLVKFHPGDSVSVGWVDTSGNSHTADVKLVVGPPL